MAKPNIYIINKGSVGAASPESKLGKRAYSVTVTVGLIEYSTPEGKKFMLIDTSMGVDWDNIKTEISKRGSLKDVSHVLITHWDQDHAQNLKEFPGALCISGIGTARIGTADYGMIDDLYPDGFIEDENIKFQVLGKSHSRDEMVYIIDSANEGKVAFIGDLIFARISELPIENVIGFEQMTAIDPIKKYLFLKGLFEKNTDLQKVFVGHSGTALSYEEFGEYIKTFEGEKYKKYLREFVKAEKEKFEKYERKFE